MYIYIPSGETPRNYAYTKSVVNIRCYLKRFFSPISLSLSRSRLKRTRKWKKKKNCSYQSFDTGQCAKTRRVQRARFIIRMNAIICEKSWTIGCYFFCCVFRDDDDAVRIENLEGNVIIIISMRNSPLSRSAVQAFRLFSSIILYAQLALFVHRTPYSFRFIVFIIMFTTTAFLRQRPRGSCSVTANSGYV